MSQILRRTRRALKKRRAEAITLMLAGVPVSAAARRAKIRKATAYELYRIFIQEKLGMRSERSSGQTRYWSYESHVARSQS
jgi:transposase-like protein